MDLKMVKHPNYLKQLIQESRSTNEYLYESDGGFLAYWQAIEAAEEKESHEKVKIATDDLPVLALRPRPQNIF